MNIDDTGPHGAGQRPAHSALLAAGIPIVEHLCNLDKLNLRNFRFFATPPQGSRHGDLPRSLFCHRRPVGNASTERRLGGAAYSAELLRFRYWSSWGKS